MDENKERLQTLIENLPRESFDFLAATVLYGEAVESVRRHDGHYIFILKPSINLASLFLYDEYSTSVKKKVLHFRPGTKVRALIMTPTALSFDYSRLRSKYYARIDKTGGQFWTDGAPFKLSVRWCETLEDVEILKGAAPCPPQTVETLKRERWELKRRA